MLRQKNPHIRFRDLDKGTLLAITRVSCSNSDGPHYASIYSRLPGDKSALFVSHINRIPENYVGGNAWIN
jgi:hypothetical protein